MKMPNKQRGLSLIELMISLVVGLILIAAVFNMYAGNVRSARFTEGMQAIQENGRYGVSVLRRGLRLAGYSPVGGIANEIDALDFDSSSATALAIQTYQPFDCNGRDTTPTGGLAVNTYALDTTNNLLTCRGNQTGSTDMAVVEVALRFALLINSGSPIRTRNRSENFVVLDEQVTSDDDRLVREVFSGSVLLRNNMTCAAI